MTEEVFRIDSQARTCEAVVSAVEEGGIVLDRTVFYPLGGGQPGDQGVLRLEDGREILIIDTRKDRETGVHHHIAAEGAPSVAPGDKVVAEIDWDRRYRLMRMHTCLHLVHSIVAADVNGCSVGTDKSRLDFNLPDQPVDKEKVQEALDQLIADDRAVTFQWITAEELEARPELLKNMSVAPPLDQGRVRLVAIEGIDLQPCGGTHVAKTGEIGPMRIGKIENKGKHNRRINIHLEA
jgi:misacylated tRNA(Ala) deacylase